MNKSSAQSISLRGVLLAVLLFSILGCHKPKSRFIGTVEIAPDLKSSLKPHAVLYIMARPADRPFDPPIAIKKFAQPLLFPIQFTLSDQDAQKAGVAIPGRIGITARISQHGPAIPIHEGDLDGQLVTNTLDPDPTHSRVLVNHIRHF